MKENAVAMKRGPHASSAVLLPEIDCHGISDPRVEAAVAINLNLRKDIETIALYVRNH